jgi:hypothetical protein
MMMNDLIAHIAFELKAARVGAHKIHDSTKAVLEACKESLQSQWVSVEDRSPPKGCPVLITDGKLIGFARKSQGGFYVLSAANHKAPFAKATHWMPLPTPPAKEQG